MSKAFGLVAALVAVAAGCGNGEESSSLTKAQFIKRADAICRKADEAQLAAVVRADKQKSIAQLDPAAQIALVVELGLPPVRKEAEELAALGAPEGDEEEVEAIVAGIEKAVQETEEDPGRASNQASGPFAAVDRLSARYGFKDCSEAF